MPPSSTLLHPEGEVRELQSPAGGCFIREFSTQLACHVSEVADLENATPSVVRKVEIRSDRYIIHYQSGFRLLEWNALRSVVQSGGPLAAWRISKLGLDLCEDLKLLHDGDIPQLVIHPGRIGQLGGRFALAANLPMVLRSLSQLLAQEPTFWQHFVAPEVLRTRGLVRSYLASADVYALGRTLMALASPDWAPPPEPIEVFRRAEQTVEEHKPEKFTYSPTIPSVLTKLFEEMCVASPSQRPTLQTVERRLRNIAVEWGPEAVFRNALGRSLAEATTIANEYARARQAGVWVADDRLGHLLKGDLALAQSPPDCARAIDEFVKAESQTRYEPDVQIRIGRAYAQFRTHPQYLQFSSDGFFRAAQTDSWSAPIIDEWVRTLEQFPQSFDRLRATEDVPFDKRPLSLIRLRAQEWLERNQPYDAWFELARSLEQTGLDDDFYAFALKVASLNEPTELMKWKARLANEEDSPMACSIVWQVNGVESRAQACLAAARRRVGKSVS